MNTISINKEITAKTTGSFDRPSRYILCATGLRFHRKSAGLLYGTKRRRRRRTRRKAADLPAQKELMFSRSGRWWDEQKADGKFLVLSYELSPSFLLLKINACGEMPVSWREDRMVCGNSVLNFMRNEHWPTKSHPCDTDDLFLTGNWEITFLKLLCHR